MLVGEVGEGWLDWKMRLADTTKALHDVCLLGSRQKNRAKEGEKRDRGDKQKKNRCQQKTEKEDTLRPLCW